MVFLCFLNVRVPLNLFSAPLSWTTHIQPFLFARYNGHPDFAHMSEEFRAALASLDTVAVVGVGNVAMDCARILAKGEKCQVPCMRCELVPGISADTYNVDAQQS